MVLEDLKQALALQNITDDKIAFITDRLSVVEDDQSGSAIWNAFCKACLDVGLNPQMIFEQAALHRADFDPPFDP